MSSYRYIPNIFYVNLCVVVEVQRRPATESACDYEACDNQDKYQEYGDAQQQGLLVHFYLHRIIFKIKEIIMRCLNITVLKNV